MKKALHTLISITILFQSVSGSSQVFFKFKQAFTSDQLSSFYSSVTMEQDILLFLGNDYKLYAYDKITGKELWATPIGYKTTRACFVFNGIVYTPYYADKKEQTAQLELATGKLVRTIPIGPLETKPVIRDGVLFGTAIIDGGMVFAYDTKKDSLQWVKFLAHGVSTQPYFFPGYIQANAEANNWVRLSYQGKLLDTVCKKKADIFVSDIPCIRIFNALTHDGVELDASFSKKLFNDEDAIAVNNTLRGVQHSFVLHEDKLAIIGNKRKLLKTIDLLTLIPGTITGRESGLSELISADEETVSFIYLDLFIRHNFKKNKLETTIDLAGWEPYRVLPDQENIWLISRKDGLLYGLSF